MYCRYLSRLCCSYSLVDPNMNTVASDNIVMTQLWKIPADKSLSCLLGDMESCEAEEIVIDGAAHTYTANIAAGSVHANTAATVPGQRTTSVKKHDYHDYLVNNIPEPESSEYDTDDLIEDAKNFVTASQTRFVDCEVWRDIDATRRQRRASRRARQERRAATPGLGDGNDQTISSPFVPKQLSDLKVGYNVRVISSSRAKVTSGVVK